MPDQPSPFELPSLGQQRVKHSEIIKMFSEMIRSRMVRGGGEINFRHCSEEEILSLFGGSGYYKLNGFMHLQDPARFLKLDVGYFALDVANLQLLVAVDPRGLEFFVRGRVSAETPWSLWRPWKNDKVDLPFDRFLLQSELAQHV
jgi:hypothetical protein